MRYAYVIRCDEVIKDDAGNVVELRCSYDPETISGGERANKKVKGTIHWVSAPHAVPIEVRLYDRLFAVPDPEDVPEGKTFLDNLNPNSKEVLAGSLVEPSVAGAAPGTRFQFERQGYFITDAEDSTPENLVFNRIVTLRDTWAKVSEQGKVSSEKAKSGKTKSGKAKAKRQKAGSEDAVGRTREDVLEALSGDAASIRAFEHFMDELGLSLTEAEVLATDAASAKLVDEAVDAGASAKAAAAWVVSVIPGELKDRSIETLAFNGSALADLIGFIDDGTISNRTAKEVLGEMMASGKAPGDIIDDKGLKQVSDVAALGGIVDDLMGKFPDKVEGYRSGKKGLIGFFVGQAMKATGGQANPQVLKGVLEEKLLE